MIFTAGGAKLGRSLRGGRVPEQLNAEKDGLAVSDCRVGVSGHLDYEVSPGAPDGFPRSDTWAYSNS